MGVEVWVLVLAQATGAPMAPAESDVLSVLESGPPERCFDVLFVGDGYRAADLAEGRYEKDVRRATDALFEAVPFSWYRASTNVRALRVESTDAGCDVGKGDKVNTAFDSTLEAEGNPILHFRAKDELLSRVTQAGAVDCVFVIVNTSLRGAGNTLLLTGDKPGRVLPAPTIAGQDPGSFAMALHALGHTLGFLNDEFTGSPSYCPDLVGKDLPGKELPPGGPNVARASDGGSSMTRDDLPWRHFCAIPDGKKLDWIFEGAGRREKDVYRPWKTCRMRDCDAPFCPVCAEELAKVLQKACAQPWNDGEFHRAHPLKLWKR